MMSKNEFKSRGKITLFQSKTLKMNKILISWQQPTHYLYYTFDALIRLTWSRQFIIWLNRSAVGSDRDPRNATNRFTRRIPSPSRETPHKASANNMEALKRKRIPPPSALISVNNLAPSPTYMWSRPTHKQPKQHDCIICNRRIFCHCEFSSTIMIMCSFRKETTGKTTLANIYTHTHTHNLFVFTME